jgi:hypothetical protein
MMPATKSAAALCRFGRAILTQTPDLSFGKFAFGYALEKTIANTARLRLGSVYYSLCKREGCIRNRVKPTDACRRYKDTGGKPTTASE